MPRSDIYGYTLPDEPVPIVTFPEPEGEGDLFARNLVVAEYLKRKAMAIGEPIPEPTVVFKDTGVAEDDPNEELAQEEPEVAALVLAVEEARRNADTDLTDPEQAGERLVELGVLGASEGEDVEPTTPGGVPLEWVALKDDDVVRWSARRKRYEKSALWRALIQGQRVFFPGKRPPDLANMYGSAHRRAHRYAMPGFRLQMRQGVWNKVAGTCVWRSDEGYMDDLDG